MGRRNSVLLTALILASAQSATAQNVIMSCGNGYMDASNNCADRPRCPAGDADRECQPGQTCFAIPVGQCAGEPTPSPTKAPVFVCGADSAAAKAGCSEGIRCPGGSGGECPAGMGCYPITWLDCGYTTTTTEATEPATTKATTTTTTTEEATQPAPVEAAFDVTMPTMPVEDDPSAVFTIVEADAGPPAQTASVHDKVQPELQQAQQTLRLCGSDYADATLCALAAECPLGDAQTECPLGYACFDVPEADCVTAEPTMAPVPTTPAPSKSPVIPPLNVCAFSYGEAVETCNDYAECANGDASTCPNGEDCWNIPVEYCPEAEAEAEAEAAQYEEEVVVPDIEQATLAPVLSPVLSVCATSIADAKVKCVDPAKDCSATGICDSEASEACFRVAREDCAGPSLVEDVIVTTVPAVAVAQTEPAVAETTGAATTGVPDVLFVCGTDYDDAQDNICTNDSCSTVNVSFFRL